MATYAKEKGFTVQTLSSDPAASIAASGSWSTGGSMNTGRQSPYSNGTQSAAWAAAGYTTTNVTLNEHYNGTAWTEVADLNSARHGSTGGAGTTTAGLVCGGDQYPSPRQIALTETWDGSSWTEVNDMNTARAGNQIVGQTYTAALTGGGLSNNGNTYEAKTEKWDGTSWTETGDLNTARWGIQGAGTSTAASFNGGDNPSGNNIGNLEQFDGSSWTETTDSNNVRRLGGSSINSTYNDFIVFGGHIGEPETTGTATEFWNGSAWTELNDLGTAESNLGGAGTSSSGLSFAGTPQISQTEEWTTTPSATFIKQFVGDVFFNSTVNAFKVTEKSVPSGVWSSGGTMNSSREQGADFGSLTAGVAAGGGGPPTNVEEYNGTSWTEVNDIPAGGAAGGATGSQTAGIIFGFKNSSPVRVDVMTYDGTNFTEVNNLNTGRNVGGSAGGLQTSALYAGGSSSIANTETWDGTSWTEVNDLNDGRYFLKGGGPTSAAVLAGGYGGSPSTNPTQSETWNGTSWSEGNEINTGRAFLTGGGSEFTSVMIFGGGPQPGGVYDNTEFWNGTSWTEMNDMATASETSHGTTQSTGFGTYRARTPAGGATEEWTTSTTNTEITST